jgi:hypothetical protein
MISFRYLVVSYGQAYIYSKHNFKYKMVQALLNSSMLWAAMVFLATVACKTDQTTTAQSKIIGRWAHTYQIKEKNSKGTFGKWITINTLVALPVLEFTKDGRILWDGKETTACCQFKTFDEKTNNILQLSNMVNSPACAAVDCAACDTWQYTISKDILVLEQCEVVHRYQHLP